LKKKFETTSAPSLAYIEKMIKAIGSWMTHLEEFKMKPEDMASTMIDDPFLIHATS